MRSFKTANEGSAFDWASARSFSTTEQVGELKEEEEGG
jgi:hypothetical protein